jgi:hypothetical protein
MPITFLSLLFTLAKVQAKPAPSPLLAWGEQRKCKCYIRVTHNLKHARAYNVVRPIVF